MTFTSSELKDKAIVSFFNTCCPSVCPFNNKTVYQSNTITCISWEVCLFVCCCFVLFVLFCLSVCLSLPVKIENIHSYGDVTTTGWGVQSLTYARHSWPLSTEGSLACHTYWDTGHPFIMAFSEDPWNSHPLPSVWQWSCHYLFIRLRNVGARIRTPNRALGGLTNICVSHFYFLQVL